MWCLWQIKLSLLTGPGLHWHLFTPNSSFCCNQKVIKWRFTTYVFTCCVSLVSTSKFDCFFPLNLTVSHTGFVVLFELSQLLWTFSSDQTVFLCFPLLLLLTAEWTVPSSYCSSFSTCCIYISCFFLPFLFSCHFLCPGFTATSLSYFYPQSRCTWTGNAFALYTCVQCDHSVFLTPSGSCLAGRITICARSTLSLFTPVLSCRSSTVWL